MKSYRVQATAFILATLLITGCDIPDRMTRLEKENAELKSQIEKDHAVRDFDLTAKCSKDARAWFNENWSRDKNTILLDFTNHYNVKLNKCFILVEFHYTSTNAGQNGDSWTNDMALTDVYENWKYADFTENHITTWKPKYNFNKEVITCDVQGQKCKTGDEFNNLVRPYMND